MKKLFKTIMVCILSASMMLSGAVGCGSGDEDDDIVIDEAKVQIYVNNYNGGAGKAWLDKIIIDFEAAYSDYKVENNGNTYVGVQIVPNNNKQEMFDDVTAEYDEVFFLDKTTNFYDMVTTGKLLDITDIVTTPNAKDNNKTIESKLDRTQVDYLKVNGKYYSIPHYEILGGLTYNRNLFNNKSFFFAKGGAPSEYCNYIQQNNSNPAPMSDKFTDLDDCIFTDLSGELSAGPDGKYGTFDDGLPATYDEFFALCDWMVLNGTNPVTWSGQFGKGYMNYLLNDLYADFDGKEMVNLSYNFNGRADRIVSNVGDNGALTFEYNVNINDSTGYKMYQTEGIYHALEFVDRLTSNSNYYSSKLTQGQAHSHTTAQTEFVLSEFNPAKWNNGKNIAMLVEGSYWENEAKDYGIFNDLSESNKTAKDVSYALLPIPKVNESYIGKKAVITEGMSGMYFARSNVASYKVEIIKEFLKFCSTDEKLQEFTAITGVTKGFNYDLSAVNGDITDFAKSVIEIRKNADVCYKGSGNPVYISHLSYFAQKFSMGVGANYCLDAFMNGMSAKDVFAGIKNYRSAANWKTSLGL